MFHRSGGTCGVAVRAAVANVARAAGGPLHHSAVAAGRKNAKSQPSSAPRISCAYSLA
jgi:hypothetical protein